MYEEDEIERILSSYRETKVNIEDLILRISKNKDERRESFKHYAYGLGRRLVLIKYGLLGVFDQIPVVLDTVPTLEQTSMATIFAQSNVINIYGALDCLAWVWYLENKSLFHGIRIHKNDIGLLKKHKKIRKKLSEQSNYKLNEFELWLEKLSNRRDFIAHQIPDYVVPFVVNPDDVDAIKTTADKLSDAVENKDLKTLVAAENELNSFKKFKPYWVQEYDEERVVLLLHHQVLSDVMTLNVITETILSELSM